MDCMNKEIIIRALENAYHLLNNEIQSIEFDELKEEYSQVILELENALNEFEK